MSPQATKILRQIAAMRAEIAALKLERSRKQTAPWYLPQTMDAHAADFDVDASFYQNMTEAIALAAQHGIATTDVSPASAMRRKLLWADFVRQTTEPSSTPAPARLSALAAHTTPADDGIAPVNDSTHNLARALVASWQR